jgi:hypothetical protein
MDIAAITRIIDNTTPFRLKSATTGRYVGKNTPVGAPYDTLVANTTDPNLAYKFIFKKDPITNSKFLASALDPTQTLTFINESGTMIPNDRWNNIAWWSYFYPNPDGSVQIKGIVQGYGTFTLSDRGPGWALGFGDPANPTAYPNRAYAWFIETIGSTPAPQVVTPAPQVVTPAPQVVTPAPQVVTPAPQVVTPAPQLTTPAPQAVRTPAPQAVTPAPQTVTPAPQAVTPAPQTVTPAPQAVTPAPYSSPTTGAPFTQTPAVTSPSPVYNQTRNYGMSPQTNAPAPEPTSPGPQPTAEAPSPEGFKFLGIDPTMWFIIIVAIILLGGGFWYMSH